MLNQQQFTTPFKMLESTFITCGTRTLAKVTITAQGGMYIGHAEVRFSADNKPEGESPFERAEYRALCKAIEFADAGSVRNEVHPVIAEQAVTTVDVHSTPPLKDDSRQTDTINLAAQASVDREIASPPPRATPQQREAVERLCKAKKQSLPRNFRDMSVDEAKAWIVSLQKMQVTVQPEPMGFHPRSEAKAIAAPLNGNRAFSLMR